MFDRLTTLIVADDNAQMRWLVATTLREKFEHIVEAADGRALFRELVHCSYTRHEEDVLVITDIRMPTYSGLDILATYDELQFHPVTVVMTAFPDDDAIASTARAGGVLIPKPFATDELVRVVDRAYVR